MSTTPENVDNPATPDVDVDVEQRPGDAGAFQYQEPDSDAETEGAEDDPAEGEPVVEPQTVEQRANEGEVRIDVVGHEQPDASQDDALVEQTDNSGEPGVEDAPQGADDVPDDQLGDESEGDDANVEQPS